MSEASMLQTKPPVAPASVHATNLALANDIDIVDVQGTGKDGLVTKADVERVVEAKEHAKTNIMGAMQAERARVTTKPETALDAAPDIPADLSKEQLMAMLVKQGDQITRLEQSMTDIEANEGIEGGFLDSGVFLARPNGNKWEERVIGEDGRTILVEAYSTQFYGPFEDEEKAMVYLNAKAKARSGNNMIWNLDILSIVSRREAKQIEA